MGMTSLGIRFDTAVPTRLIAAMLIAIDILFYNDSAANKMHFGGVEDGLSCLQSL